MRLLNWLAVAIMCFGTSAQAQSTNTATNAAASAIQVPGWEAVGRLTMSGRSMCTGALIAPDLVLTAAHCMYDIRTHREVKPSKIEFQAGLYADSAVAVRRVKKAIINDQYVHHMGRDAQVGHDLAILVLESPISANVVKPLRTDQRPNKGDSVMIIGYTQFSATKPVLAKPCYILARKHDTVVTSCEVEFGTSGAPVFAVQGGGNPQLVSVISAKAAMGGQAVSIGTALDATLKRLLAQAG
ncbi:MAG: trypsin-like serine protease [Pseudomonadota bacterium]